MIKGPAPAALPRIGVLERLVDRLPVVAPELLAWLYGALLVGLLAGHEGGFLATSWGWCALVTLWLAAVALLVQERIQIGVEGLAFLGGLFAFLVWVALSNLWTASQTATMHEVQRDLAYFGIAAATVAIANRDTIARIAGGAATAVFFLSIYGLLTRVAPDHFGAFDSTSYGYRLSPPITYWNGLGLFAAMGFLLMLGFARRGHGILVRAAAAFTLPALAVTLYFTFSRGAWIALGCGFLVLLAVTVERVKLVLAVAALAPWCVFALRSAHARPALITVGSSYTNAVQQGHSLLLVLLVLSVGSGVSAAVLALATHRFHVPSAAEKAFSAALVVAALAAVGALFVHYGSPTQVAKSTWHQFTGVPKQTGDNVSARLFQLSSNGRVEIWRTALRAFQRHPRVWQRSRHLLPAVGSVTVRLLPDDAGPLHLFPESRRAGCSRTRPARSGAGRTARCRGSGAQAPARSGRRRRLRRLPGTRRSRLGLATRRCHGGGGHPRRLLGRGAGDDETPQALRPCHSRALARNPGAGGGPRHHRRPCARCRTCSASDEPDSGRARRAAGSTMGALVLGSCRIAGRRRSGQGRASCRAGRLPAGDEARPAELAALGRAREREPGKSTRGRTAHRSSP